MKIDFKNIINISNINDLNKFPLNKPIFLNNYIFHYLIIYDKLPILKLVKFPIYKENDEGFNGFFLAAKYDNFEILHYLIETYPEYIYNKNSDNNVFIDLIKFSDILQFSKYKLEWDRLLRNKIDILFYNYSFNELNTLFSFYKPQNHYLNFIILNEHLSIKEIINILDLFPNEICLHNSQNDQSLIFPAIKKKNIDIIKYLIDKNVDLDYYTYLDTYHPLKKCLLNNFGFEILWNKIKKSFNYALTDKNLNTFTHFILENKIINTVTLEILLNTSSSIWNQNNIYRITPIELLVENFDFDKYKYLLNNKQINYKNKIKNKWTKYISTLPKFKDDNNVKLFNYKYTHVNIFQATFKDISLYMLYLQDKYKHLYIPQLDDINLTNLNYMENTGITFPDQILDVNYKFPWIICYSNKDEYWIHTDLNNLINAQRRSKKYNYACCFLSIRLPDDGLHANVIIYDFNNLTVERFDSYGNTTIIDCGIDDILEEELTWNTGFTYNKPSDYMPVSSFQVVSDELNPYKQKIGDFGGFCLAWSIWYVEHRIINKNIKNNTLVVKLISKLSKLQISFIDYIRNYANHINHFRYTYLINIGIDPTIISNITFPNYINNEITNFILKKY